jgi:hypothetical protein
MMNGKALNLKCPVCGAENQPVQVDIDRGWSGHTGIRFGRNTNAAEFGNGFLGSRNRARQDTP